MSETPASRSELWRQRLRRLRAGLRRIVPFASGVLAALVALLLYNALVPAPHQLTTREVNDTVAQAMASATPPPAYSERVYQVIQPSLVLIQTARGTPDGEDEHGLGSGVVINDSGDILTSLHVVADATDIQLPSRMAPSRARRYWRSSRRTTSPCCAASQPPAQLVPAILGNPNAMQRRRRGLCRRQSLWPVRLDERGRHLRLRPLLPPAQQHARRCKA